jgi:hypothetical protein
MLLAHGAADIARLAAALNMFAFTRRDDLPCFCRYIVPGDDHNEKCKAARAALAAVRDGGR